MPHLDFEEMGQTDVAQYVDCFDDCHVPEVLGSAEKDDCVLYGHTSEYDIY